MPADNSLAGPIGAESSNRIGKNIRVNILVSSFVVPRSLERSCRDRVSRTQISLEHPTQHVSPSSRSTSELYGLSIFGVKKILPSSRHTDRGAGEPYLRLLKVEVPLIYVFAENCKQFLLPLYSLAGSLPFQVLTVMSSPAWQMPACQWVCWFRRV